MILSDEFKGELHKEFNYLATRSSGPGGQNVNKVSSKVELRFNVILSKVLTAEQKLIINQRLANKLTSDLELIITSQEDRSQLRNKQLATEKIFTLINWALTPQKRRVHTRPTKSSKEKRIQLKKHRSEIKLSRRKADFK